MEKVWLSTTFYSDPAVEALSGNAERLLIRAMAHCGNAETEGVLTLSAAKRLGIPGTFSRISELVSAGILEKLETPDTYRFTAWDKWQGSGNELVRRKKADAERQARKRAADREKARMSRDTSREVTPTEKRREEKEVTTDVVTSTAAQPQTGDAGTGLFAVDDPKQAAESKPKKPASKGTRLPDDWEPSEDLVLMMTTECPGVDLRAEHRVFVDYWIGRAGAAGVKADWSATWRNWMRRAAKNTRSSFGQAAPAVGGLSKHDAKVQNYLDIGERLTAKSNHHERRAIG